MFGLESDHASIMLTFLSVSFLLIGIVLLRINPPKKLRRYWAEQEIRAEIASYFYIGEIGKRDIRSKIEKKYNLK